MCRALDYCVKRWAALSRYIYDGGVPVDNNWCDDQIRPGLLDARTALRRVATRWETGGCDHEFDPVCATQRVSEIDQLLPHQWIQA